MPKNILTALMQCGIMKRMNNLKGPGLSKETILDAFSALNEKFEQQGVIGEVCVFGGTAMVLAFNARLSTHDVDAIFSPTDVFRRCSVTVAHEKGLPEDWLNDGVKGFVSGKGMLTTDDLPQFANLRVTRPTAEYLLAMKCMAARAPGYDTQGDRQDIAFLIKHLQLKDAESAIAIVEEFYGPSRILPKTQFMILEAFEQLHKTPEAAQPRPLEVLEPNTPLDNADLR